eukprot:10885406-Prorocentrum_lima.AAC.1
MRTKAVSRGLVRVAIHEHWTRLAEEDKTREEASQKKGRDRLAMWQVRERQAPNLGGKTPGNQ